MPSLQMQQDYQGHRDTAKRTQDSHVDKASRCPGRVHVTELQTNPCQVRARFLTLMYMMLMTKMKSVDAETEPAGWNFL